MSLLMSGILLRRVVLSVKKTVEKKMRSGFNIAVITTDKVKGIQKDIFKIMITQIT